ncbi:oxygen-dependent coproporphyrinogen oxidase [Pseudanabaena sp. FACHB-1998]|uniref:oxygen-dependent coproporphyrinogen oxidase n=1 Tax=Pseudanabaena sp. FACHB-1998 TaxID=2692858 RepID=UPI0016804085|nr:oxygen-dependent coproporphyrinogen oxidase [Pseudanabaena sp. FACHB-1998]MBD2179140.1 oxygen-dependent coproporphyrinogen oxidase [Pseudanabaena sp. FACHB-1998]
MTIAPIAPKVSPKVPTDSKARVSQFMQSLQDSICQGLEELDGKTKFKQDQWERPEGGGGRSRVITDGDYFEKGGVNFSEVSGTQLPPAILRQHPEASGHNFYATGTSMVLHPHNPYAPTVHLNYRYFEAGPIWWFGGGLDLTPYYGFAEDAHHLHTTLKDACDRHNPHYYPVFKQWCDDYFYLKHRGETRGVGGIFFDYQNGEDGLYKNSNDSTTAQVMSDEIGDVPRTWEEIFAFIKTCGNSFLPAYTPIANRRRNMEYGDREKQWQLYRRGRYVEFNLVYDRGTIFGLQTNGRTESILMSLPPLVRWDYDYKPEPNTPEAELHETFLKPQDWANWKF